MGTESNHKSSGVKTRYVINLHKLLVVPIYIATLAYYDGLKNFSEQPYAPAAALLIASHGFYSWAWLFKDSFFGDKQWKEEAPIAVAITMFFIFPLNFYYLPMFCLVSDKCPLETFGQGNEPLLLGAAAFCYNYGLFFHYCSDLQKTLMLNQPGERKLTTNMFFKYSRNPNYFGEVMIYLGYALYSMSYFVLASFVLTWLVLFVPNMIKKDKSLSRYPTFSAWKASTGFLFPSLSIYTDTLKYSFTEENSEIKSS